MEKLIICGTIPVTIISRGMFIRTGEYTYVTLRPIAKDVKTKSEAIDKVTEYEKLSGIPTRMITKKDWDDVINFCRTNYCLREFIGLNQFESIQNPEDIFWSMDDSENEYSKGKAVFVAVTVIRQ